MARPDFHEQLAALKSENRQLRQELEERRERRLVAASEPSDPERDLHAISEMLAQFGSAIEDQWGDRSRELSAHVDRLAAEVASLRSEVLAAREAASRLPADRDGPGHRIVLRPAEEPVEEIIIEQTVDGVWRRIRWPWFYLPLLWGMILLAVALLVFWYLAL